MEKTFETNEQEWESFLQRQPWTPFLQSFPMGEVYKMLGEEPVRLAVREGAGAGARIVGICQAIIVPAKRGRHLAVMYGPILGKHQIPSTKPQDVLILIVEELKRIAGEKDCAFIRMSPFWVDGTNNQKPITKNLSDLGFRPSPLHLLAEHIWFLNLQGKSEDDLRRAMRSTTRNLIGRAEREGVTVSASDDPVRDLPHFLKLHEETRKRHGFTPYTDDFFRAQVAVFAPKKQCTLYLARYQNEVIAASIHMIYGSETSYHHGASTAKFSKIPASYLLQWTAIRDALRRGDRVYNFWGVAPLRSSGNPKPQTPNPKHPFAGVTTFKTGFGGELLELVHCMDLPLSKRYFLTWGIETIRKWRRGF